MTVVHRFSRPKMPASCRPKLDEKTHSSLITKIQATQVRIKSSLITLHLPGTEIKLFSCIESQTFDILGVHFGF
jgi:hypothetical protein